MPFTTFIFQNFLACGGLKIIDFLNQNYLYKINFDLSNNDFTRERQQFQNFRLRRFYYFLQNFQIFSSSLLFFTKYFQFFERGVFVCTSPSHILVSDECESSGPSQGGFPFKTPYKGNWTLFLEITLK